MLYHRTILNVYAYFHTKFFLKNLIHVIGNHENKINDQVRYDQNEPTINVNIALFDLI